MKSKIDILNENEHDSKNRGSIYFWVQNLFFISFWKCSKIEPKMYIYHQIIYKFGKNYEFAELILDIITTAEQRWQDLCYIEENDRAPRK